MIYFGLVDHIKENHKSGFYGRSLPKSGGLKITTTDLISIGALIGGTVITLTPMIGMASRLYNNLDFLRFNKRIRLINNGLDQSNKLLVISNDSLTGDYNINGDNEILYGLFDNFKDKSAAFKTIMVSGGGASLTIVEKDKVNKKHWGGECGKFNSGLYCEHPKDRDILIPLENSSELIKSFILEETLSAFEALGAKSILIEDITESEASIHLDDKTDSVSGKVGVTYKKEILREKEFGKGTFDIERAERNKYYLFDFPNLKTVIESRKFGNQIKEEFTENINLSANFDVNVLQLFSFQTNFRFHRKWHFKIKFFDKNDY